MQTKHTPGQWEVKNYPAVGYPFFIQSEFTSSHVALIGLPSEGNNNIEEAEANAKLIAAAPELLEALTNMVNRCPEYDRFMNANAAATEHNSPLPECPDWINQIHSLLEDLNS